MRLPPGGRGRSPRSHPVRRARTRTPAKPRTDERGHVRSEGASPHSPRLAEQSGNGLDLRDRIRRDGVRIGVVIAEFVRFRTVVVKDGQRPRTSSRQAPAAEHDGRGDQPYSHADPDARNALNGVPAESVAGQGANRAVQTGGRLRHPSDPVRRRCLHDRRDAVACLPIEKDSGSRRDRSRADEVRRTLRDPIEPVAVPGRGGVREWRRILGFPARPGGPRPQLLRAASRHGVEAGSRMRP